MSKSSAISRIPLTPVAAAIRLIVAGALAASGSAVFGQSTSAGKETTLTEVKIVATPEASYVVKSTSSATKTDTLLRDTPQSITVISRELMRDQNMQSMADAIRYVPGIVSAQGEGNRDTAVFRGNSSTSDFYVDGMRDDVQYYRDFYNIESVEFLKGSNAMIFGRGGSGGVINRVTKQPSWAPVREGSLTLGSWNNRRASVDVGQAVSDKAAVRVNALVEDSGSYRNGVDIERRGINPSMLLRAGPDTSLALSYEHFRDQRTADRGVPSLGGGPFATDPSAFFGNPELSFATVRMNAFSAVLDHDFGNGFSVRNRTRVADYDKFYQNVYAAGAANPATAQVPLSAYNDLTLRTSLLNQTDLFYTLNTGAVKHKLVAGLELGHTENDNLRNLGRVDGQTTFNGALSNPVARGPVVFTNLPTPNHTDASVASVYLQDQIEFTPQFMAVAGLRYDRFRTKHFSNAGGAALEVLDTPVSPRLGLVYKPAEAVSIYGNYSVAYVPRAGEQLSSLTVTTRALDPEEFKNIELGVKWDISPELAASAAVYQLERSNVSVVNPRFPLQAFLADGQTTEGVELSLSGRLTRAWSVMGGYAYQDAKLAQNQDFPALNGATLAMVPEHSASLWNRYEITPQWAAALGVSYRGAIFAAVDNKVALPSYTRLDAAVYYKLNNNYQLQLNVENLLDKQYYASAHNNNNITPGSPRAVRLTVNARF